MVQESQPVASPGISLEHPYPDSAEGNKAASSEALRIMADKSVVDNALSEMAKGKEQSVSDPDLRRQVEEERLAKIPEAATFEAKVDQLKRYDEGIASQSKLMSEMTPVDMFLDWIQGSPTERNLRASEQVANNLRSFIAEVGEQRDNIAAIQELIINNPSMMKELQSQAEGEARIVQRMALGYAIYESLGPEHMRNEEEVKQLADMYNRGEFTIEDRHYEKGSEAYVMTVEALRSHLQADERELSRRPPNETEDVANARIRSFFDPVRQVKTARIR
jgi:hypothetical protein